MWAWAGAVWASVLGLMVGLPAHYPNNFDTLAHLGPLYPATAVFVAGAALSYRAILPGRT